MFDRWARRSVYRVRREFRSLEPDGDGFGIDHGRDLLLRYYANSIEQGGVASHPPLAMPK